MSQALNSSVDIVSNMLGMSRRNMLTQSTEEAKHRNERINTLVLRTNAAAAALFSALDELPDENLRQRGQEIATFSKLYRRDEIDPERYFKLSGELDQLVDDVIQGDTQQVNSAVSYVSVAINMANKLKEIYTQPYRNDDLMGALKREVTSWFFPPSAPAFPGNILPSTWTEKDTENFESICNKLWEWSENGDIWSNHIPGIPRFYSRLGMDRGFDPTVALWDQGKLAALANQSIHALNLARSTDNANLLTDTAASKQESQIELFKKIGTSFTELIPLLRKAIGDAAWQKEFEPELIGGSNTTEVSCS